MPRINGIEMNIETRGTGDDVILIHGGLVDARMWDDQMDSLAEHFRVTRYDLPGFGDTDMHQDKFSFIDDLLLLMASQKIKTASLVGLSLGGMIALDFALEHPHRVDKLVLPAASIRGFDYEGAQDWVQDYFNALNLGREAAVRFWLGHAMFATAREHPDIYGKMQVMLYENFSSWNPLSNKPEVIWPDPTTIDRLDEITVPALVMIGEGDTDDLKGCADKLTEAIPDAQQISYPVVGHHLPMEIPEQFNADVIQFLQAS